MALTLALIVLVASFTVLFVVKGMFRQHLDRTIDDQRSINR